MVKTIFSIEFDNTAVEAVKSAGICLATAVASAMTKDPVCLWALVLLFLM